MHQMISPLLCLPPNRQAQLCCVYYTDLGVESAPRVAQVLSITQDEARQDLLLLNALQTQLEVLAWPSIVRLRFI